MSATSPLSPKIVCLLPARNAESDLPGYFDSVGLVCDAIVALDDGSTDATHDLLAAHPLVVRLLTNERRDDYATWDDATNRNRLLAAAADLDPEWILSIDADERFDPTDAAALRAFVATDALPGCAYGLRHMAMRGDPDHYVPREQTVYRLFAYAPGQRFPKSRLHFVPVPTSIPRARWIRTTLRLQHLGSLTSERRLARFVKYLEADPDRRYHADYSHLLTDVAPAELRRWTPRPADLPVLLDAVSVTDDNLAANAENHDADRNGPALSAIVIARDDVATIARTVASVVNQEVPEPFETIAVVSGSPRTAAVVRASFPNVTLIELVEPALPGEARNAGLRVARGEFVSFPGSHVELPPGSLSARLRAHRAGFAMVTGVAENGTQTRAGWASYFMDQHQGLPGQRRTVLDRPPHRCSYAREPLLSVGGFPEGTRTAEDTAVNEELARRGYVALREPAIRFVHRSPCRTPWRLIRHHFRRGRGRGWLLLQDARPTGGLLTRRMVTNQLLGYLPRWLRAIERGVKGADPDLWPHYQRSRSLIVAGAVASVAGTWFEVLRPGPGKWALLRGRPVRTLGLVVTEGVGPTILLVRLDAVAGTVRVVAVPLDLPAIEPDGTRRPLKVALQRVEGAEDGFAFGDPVDLLSRAVDLLVDDLYVLQAAAVRCGATEGYELHLTPREIVWSTARARERRNDVRYLRRGQPFPIVEVARLGDDADREPASLIRAIHLALGIADDRAQSGNLRPIGDQWWP